jgi:L-amino acid N-acyltransferase YncA
MGEVTIRDAVAIELPAMVDLQNALLATSTVEWTDVPYAVEGRGEWLGRQHALHNPVSDFRDTTKSPGYRFTVEHTIHVREETGGAESVGP